MSYYKSFNLPVTILRPFNCFGPRQSSRAIIPTIISQILDNKIVKLGNLKPTRDFTFVEDTALSFVKAIKNKRSYGQIINVGNSFEISINELIKIFRNELGYKFNLKLDKKRVRPKKSEVMRLFASNIKAKQILKWKPHYNERKGFKKGLVKTIEWLKIKKNKELYNTKNYII